ncbi:MAG: hypothetical protein R8P61_36885 [Bacteroidia bacterium]|nr:hypothetical protein [Bacteroidia bacterium]
MKDFSPTTVIKRKTIGGIRNVLKAVKLEDYLYKQNRNNLRLQRQGIQDITLSAKGGLDINKATALIERQGIAIITDYFEEDLINKAGSELGNFIKDFDKNKQGETYGEYNEVEWQYFGHKYNKSEITNMPIVNIRNKDKGKNDGGMIDVYNVDKIAEKKSLSASLELFEKLKSGDINTLTNNLMKGYNSRFNLYFNDSILNTRGAHRDDYETTYKVFTYLTDVTDESYGPYAFVPGSQKVHDYLNREIALNNFFGKDFGDISSMPDDLFVKCIGKKGTVIISDQSGVHRGVPQADGKVRLALVNSFIKT